MTQDPKATSNRSDKTWGPKSSLQNYSLSHSKNSHIAASGPWETQYSAKSRPFVF